MDDITQLILEKLDKLEDISSNVACIKSDMNDVNDHLAKLNSKVAVQERENFQRQLDLVNHVQQCVSNDRMNAVEKYVTETKASATTNQKWLKVLQPVIMFIAGGGLVLMLSNATVLLQALGVGK
jgi:hypothetical protein